MAFDPLARLRRTLHLTFGGSEAVPAWQYELEQGEDGGYFAPHSAVWSVHGGMTPIVAGVRALLVQALHPGALAGVAEHSNYERDALGRLAGTIRWIFTVTYGSTDAARRACEHVRKLHVPVRGHYAGADGEPTSYSANSPHLGLWVHCAFADAFLRAYEEHRGPVPVPPDALPGESGADAYVREWAVAGELMGVQDPPRSEAALRAALAGFDERGELRCGPPWPASTNAASCAATSAPCAWSASSGARPWTPPCAPDTRCSSAGPSMRFPPAGASCWGCALRGSPCRACPGFCARRGPARRSPPGPRPPPLRLPPLPDVAWGPRGWVASERGSCCASRAPRS